MNELTIESSKANLIGMLFLIPSIVLFGVPFYVLWHQSINMHIELQIISDNMLYLLFIVVGLVLVHEAIHGLAYVILTKGKYQNISFGIIWKNLTPYCHYSAPISVRKYRIAVIAPGIIIGLAPLIFALFVGNFLLFVWGILFTLGAVGDFVIFWIIRHQKGDTLLQDHPHKIGCIILNQSPDHE